MPKTHIVGKKHSFTYGAWKERYDDENHFKPYKHAKLVSAQLGGGIPPDETSIIPLWNSNSGTVDMDNETKTAELFLGNGGTILDLWPNKITYGLGVNGNDLSKTCNIYSVKVAKDQCRKFLKKLKVHSTDRFRESKTTTDAGKSFQENSIVGDGLLCPKEYLRENDITTKRNLVTNPFNTTIFSTFNSLPRFHKENNGDKFSLGCMLVDLSNNELSFEFGDYWQSLLPLHQAEQHEEILYDIPKILFILRYDESNALLLLEMPTTDPSVNPWPEPERDADVVNVNLETFTLKGQVGVIQRSFSAKANSIFTNSFKVDEDEIVFYGLEETFIWASPGLNIFVHGFDQNLVKECALLQVLNLVRFLDYGIFLPAAAKRLLKSFKQGRGRLKLSPDSQPDTV